jgi:tetracycline 7-halogenase / FADH2 O2-dependent halogenase
MKRSFDIAVVGSGFAGSLIAMIARRLGRTVVLLERGKHPRFAIGESSTPLANLLLEELARRYDLPQLLPLTKWGAWQAAHPELACGLKRGFTFYHHRWSEPFADTTDHARQLLVAASPHDRIADTHWYRPDFDHFFVRTAQSIGVEYLDEVKLTSAVCEPDGVTLSGTRDHSPVTFKARFVLDATGPRGFLHHALQLSEAGYEHYPATEALFSHFTDVKRFTEEPHAPYPPDDAALHHVFPGGWIWVLRFNNGITSAGVAATSAVAKELNFAAGESAWHKLLEKLPSVAGQFAPAKACVPFIHQPRLAFRSGQITGPNWALLPSAAGFLDPLLSTGFPLTLLGVERLGRAFENDWGSARFAAVLADYATQTKMELQVTAEMVGALYANMADAEVFNALTQLYFAAASYAETARRLERPELAAGFLLHRHPDFGATMRECLARARRPMSPVERKALIADIARVIEPVNVAGLAQSRRRNWYPVLAEDLFASAHKLGAGRREIEVLLERCGFAA